VNVYVTPPAVPGAPGTGAGTEEDPFTSVADGIKAAQNGGTVYLRGGHYVESVELEAVSGVDVQRIVVQPFGDGEVFIDSLLPEFLVPGAEDGWDPVTPPGEPFNGEYVWRKPYPAPGTELDRWRVIGGAFLDEPVHRNPVVVQVVHPVVVELHAVSEDVAVMRVDRSPVAPLT